MPKEDFVNVQLTDFGKERAGNAPFQVHEGNHSFIFHPGEVKMVTRAFDWGRVLQNQHFNGHPLFEIVDEHAEEVAAELRADLGVQAHVEGGIPVVDVKEE
jgi:hypothetical protein